MGLPQEFSHFSLLIVPTSRLVKNFGVFLLSPSVSALVPNDAPLRDPKVMSIVSRFLEFSSQISRATCSRRQE